MKNTQSKSDIVFAGQDGADRIQVERRSYERRGQTVNSLRSKSNRSVFGVDVYPGSRGATVRKEKRELAQRRTEVDKAKAPS
jgi:hypothetical protein